MPPTDEAARIDEWRWREACKLVRADERVDEYRRLVCENITPPAEPDPIVPDAVTESIAADIGLHPSTVAAVIVAYQQMTAENVGDPNIKPAELDQDTLDTRAVMAAHFYDCEGSQEMIRSGEADNDESGRRVRAALSEIKARVRKECEAECAASKQALVAGLQSPPIAYRYPGTTI